MKTIKVTKKELLPWKWRLKVDSEIISEGYIQTHSLYECIRDTVTNGELSSRLNLRDDETLGEIKIEIDVKKDRFRTTNDPYFSGINNENNKN